MQGPDDNFFRRTRFGCLSLRLLLSTRDAGMTNAFAEMLASQMRVFLQSEGSLTF